MSKRTDEILVSHIGNLVVSNARQQEEIELLREENNGLKMQVQDLAKKLEETDKKLKAEANK